MYAGCDGNAPCAIEFGRLQYGGLIVAVPGRCVGYALGMHVYKNFENHVLNLPKGYANERVNTFWMLVFLPLLLPLAALVCIVIGGLGYALFELIFK